MLTTLPTMLRAAGLGFTADRIERDVASRVRIPEFIDLEYDVDGNVLLASEPPSAAEKRIVEQYLAAGRIADAERVLDGREYQRTEVCQ